MHSYHQVAEPNLWMFLAEIECRDNFRHDRGELFEKLMSH